MSETLYNTEILRLAASIPYQTRLTDPAATSVKVSPICGSRVTADVDLDAEGRVVRFGQEVRACALGQASAAILGAGILGKTPDELARARDALAAWLSGAADEPPADWPRLALFTPARDQRYKGRHPSIQLAFQAAAEAALEAAARTQAEPAAG